MLVTLFFALLGLLYPNGNQNVEREEYVPVPGGPQSWEEEAIARKALHGPHYGGDMIFPDDYNTTDAAVRNERFRWPGYPGRAEIAYVIDNSAMQGRDVIMRGIDVIHKHTCVRLVKRTNQRDYVRIFFGDGCWSIIGRAGGEQPLSLGSGCYYVGLVIHELCHAFGLMHEHQRSDRDTYINVYKQNVIPGQEHNFDKTNANNEMHPMAPYDYGSIMHYGETAFSKDPSRLKTMEAKNGFRISEPYTKLGFTPSDLKLIKQMYKC